MIDKQTVGFLMVIAPLVGLALWSFGSLIKQAYLVKGLAHTVKTVSIIIGMIAYFITAFMLAVG